MQNGPLSVPWHDLHTPWVGIEQGLRWKANKRAIAPLWISLSQLHPKRTGEPCFPRNTRRWYMHKKKDRQIEMERETDRHYDTIRNFTPLWDLEPSDSKCGPQTTSITNSYELELVWNAESQAILQTESNTLPHQVPEAILRQIKA